MKLTAPILEDWMRDYYFSTRLDLGGSGVPSYSFGEIRRICGISGAALNNVVLGDSPTNGWGRFSNLETKSSS